MAVEGHFEGGVHSLTVFTEFGASSNDTGADFVVAPWAPRGSFQGAIGGGPKLCGLQRTCRFRRGHISRTNQAEILHVLPSIRQICSCFYGTSDTFVIDTQCSRILITYLPSYASN